MTDAARLREIARKNQLQIDAANEQFGPKRAGFSEFCDDTRAMFAIADRLEKREALLVAARKMGDSCPNPKDDYQMIGPAGIREFLDAYMADKEAECE